MKTSSQQLARAIRAQKKTPRKSGKFSVKSGRAPDWSRSDQRRTTGRWEFIQRSA